MKKSGAQRCGHSQKVADLSSELRSGVPERCPLSHWASVPLLNKDGRTGGSRGLPALTPPPPRAQYACGKGGRGGLACILGRGESPGEEGRDTGGGGSPQTALLPACLDAPSCLPHPTPVAFLKGLSDKQREEHYFCKDFIRLKKIPTWKETAKGRPCTREGQLAIWWVSSSDSCCGSVIPTGPGRMAAAFRGCLLCGGHFNYEPDLRRVRFLSPLYCWETEPQSHDRTVVGTPAHCRPGNSSPGASHFTCLGLSFRVCKMGMDNFNAVPVLKPGEIQGPTCMPRGRGAHSSWMAGARVTSPLPLEVEGVGGGAL